MDPGYAPAYVGLADSHIVLGNFGTYRPKDIAPVAKAAALKALEIDNRLGEAHASLAQVIFNFDWDWVGAEREYVKAIELRPSYATAHHWYALYLSHAGRLDQSVTEIRRAQELDPLSPAIANNVGAVYLVAHRYDDALAATENVIELHPEYPAGHQYRGWILLMMGSYAHALPALLRARELSSGTDVVIEACLGFAYARLGQQKQALKIAGC